MSYTGRPEGPFEEWGEYDFLLANSEPQQRVQLGHQLLSSPLPGPLVGYASCTATDRQGPWQEDETSISQFDVEPDPEEELSSRDKREKDLWAIFIIT